MWHHRYATPLRTHHGECAFSENISHRRARVFARRSCNHRLYLCYCSLGVLRLTKGILERDAIPSERTGCIPYDSEVGWVFCNPFWSTSIRESKGLRAGEASRTPSFLEPYTGAGTSNRRYGAVLSGGVPVALNAHLLLTASPRSKSGSHHTRSTGLHGRAALSR